MVTKNIWKSRRLRQILLLVGSSIIILWILVAILFYNFTVSQHEQFTLMRLAGIANSLSLQMNGDQHDALFKTYKTKDDITQNNQDSTYSAFHRLLKSNYEANMLKSPIYTIAMNEGGKFYEFGITSDTTPYFRHAYNTYHPLLNDHYQAGGMIPEYKDEFGMWLSAFAPIKNSIGKTVAVVMVDEKLDDFIKSVRSELLKAFFKSLIIFGILIVLLLWQMGKILNREQKDKNIIESANEKISTINKQLEEANGKLNKMDQFRKEMISNISHDLRTPMASIIGFLELERDGRDSLSQEDRNKYLDIAYTETNRLNRMVSDLFELSKLESGQIKINPETFNIYELVSDIIQKYELKIKAKNVNLKFEINENQGQAFGDIKYLDRVLQNLIDNAVRYVDEGGRIKIGILDEGEYFKVKVCNSGDLIPQAELDVIFDRYYTSEKTDQARSGLGLAIAKSICNLHNCTIKSESNELFNSFWFTVPKYILPISED